MAADKHAPIKNVTAVLGPTNTGKTHLAIERMIGHQSGIIGLPLRLLAREVYDKVSARVGADQVALVTGEEKIKPPAARFWVATAESMPLDLDVEFVAIDEVQLAGDPERGHVFTDRILNARGSAETLLLGSQTIRDAIDDLIPGANFISRPRLSKLTYSGQKKITRIKPRSAVIAFSANEVYAIAELIRRQLGGTAVVLGALSPRTRNAQVALYQSGDVDYLVATDAIGMGLNLDVDHVAFSANRKFDGAKHRELTAAETGQIAGRAGRHLNDGTFGVTGSCEPFDAELVERLENHQFDSVKALQWRNRDLDFSSLGALMESLRLSPNHARLSKARASDDVLALETLSEDGEIRKLAASREGVERLWDVCQVPDYRKISAQNHAEMLSKLYHFLMSETGKVPEDWFANQVQQADRTDGDIDTLSNRLSHIRTWTYVSNRTTWLDDAEGWQGRTRDVEDRLSDALHECLTQRFVDQRTSALMRGMRDKDELSAEISDDGSVHVENHFIGRLKGFRFAAEGEGDGVHGRAHRNATAQVLSRELAMRARRVASAEATAFKFDASGQILWRDEPIAALEASDDPLNPTVSVLADEHLSVADSERVKEALENRVRETIKSRLQPLVDAAEAADIEGLAKGIAFRLREELGTLKRETIADDVKSLDQPARGQLRKHGLRFGAFNLFFPHLLKPASSELTALLWMLRHGKAQGLDRFALPPLPRPGLTSVAREEQTPDAYYRAAGYHVCGPRVVRIDILERLADLIRPLLAWRKKPNSDEAPPAGATGDGGFLSTPQMMSILGCSEAELAQVLSSLGFVAETREIQNAASDPDSAASSGSEPAGVASTAEASEQSQGPEGEAETGSDVHVEETKPETVWRPARKHFRRGRQAPRQSAEKESSKPGTVSGQRRPEGRRGRDDKRAKQRRHQKSAKPVARVHTARPPKQDAGGSASPFSALSALRDQLGQRTDKQDSET